jgi:hypothetical protein
VLAVVEQAGRDRFAAKAARFEADLTVADADQVLWRGLAEALGYTRNVMPFGRLADAVPWLAAAEVARERGPVAVAGLLLGNGGLLRESTLPESLAWWTLRQRRGWRVAMSAEAWDRRAIRKANGPAHRCRGLAELAARFSGSSGCSGNTGCSACSASSHLFASSSRAQAAPPAPPVQPSHNGGCAAGASTARRAGLAEQAIDAVCIATTQKRPRLWEFARASPWIGRGRAQAVAINVLLPFAAASGLAEQAEALFMRLPGEPTNRVVRYMATQLAGPGIRFRGACHQQGLLHLFKQTCASRVCERCPARELGGWHALEMELSAP